MSDSAMLRLPTYQTTLIGRSEEAEAVATILQGANERLVTLVGESGAGKTRLALEVAASVAASFRDGVVFVALAPVQDPAFVIPTIAHALGVSEHGQEPLLDTLRKALRDSHLLVVVDNLEQVRAAAPDLVQLLQAAPSLTLLLTSQVALGVAEERVYLVPPLSVPAEHSVLDPATLLRFPAVALFTERLQAVQPRFQLTARTASAVLRICRLLDGFPLAIELVAAHSATIAPQDLLLLLRHHLGVDRALQTPQWSSRAAILRPVLDWCISRLTPAAQDLFGHLGIFLGGWTVESVKEVAQIAQPDQEVADLLATLVSKHLVLHEALPGQEDRYVMLDAVRDYSEIQARQRGAWADISERHATYYARLAEQAEGALRGPEQPVWLHRLDAELHNIRLALAWGMEQAQPIIALRLGAALGLFWIYRGYYTEGRRWLEAALARAGDADSVAAKAWRVAGSLAYRQGDYAAATSALERGLALGQQHGDLLGQASSLSILGAVMQNQGHVDRARSYYEQGLAAARQADEADSWTLRNILNNLGAICAEQGDYRLARQHHRESLHLRRQFADQNGIASSLINLGDIALSVGQYDEAQELLEESLQLYELLGHRYGSAACLDNLGAVAIEQGRYDQARAYDEQALAIYQATEDQRGQGMMLAALGYLEFVEGHYPAAEARLREAQAILEAMGERYYLWRALLTLGLVAYAQGQDAAAWTALRQSLVGARDYDMRRVVIEALEGVAALWTRQGRWQAAVPIYAGAGAAREALEIPRPPSAQGWYAPALAAAQSAPAATVDQLWQAGRQHTLAALVEQVLNQADGA